MLLLQSHLISIGLSQPKSVAFAPDSAIEKTCIHITHTDPRFTSLEVKPPNLDLLSEAILNQGIENKAIEIKDPLVITQ